MESVNSTSTWRFWQLERLMEHKKKKKKKGYPETSLPDTQGYTHTHAQVWSLT
jgi:hypothetical protein